MQAWKRWQDWVTLVVGVALVVAALVWAGARAPAMTTVLVLAVVLVAASLVALARPEMMADRWIVAAIGVLLVLAPWVMGYADIMELAWTSWIGGVVTVVIEAMSLPQLRRAGGAQPHG
jgi:ABC-type molybdate transport system permease subunit